MWSKSRKRTASALGAAALAAMLIAAALVKTAPDVYSRTARVGADHPGADRFNEEVVNGVGNVLLDKSGGTRLDVVITEEMASARLVRFLEERRARGDRLPVALAGLRIGFEPGRLVLATRMGRGLSSLVVSQHFSLLVMEDGRLRMEPVGMRAGLLPLPVGLSRRLTQSLRVHLERLEAKGSRGTNLVLWRAALGALEGEPVALEGKKLGIRLERLEVERGRLHVVGRRSERDD